MHDINKNRLQQGAYHNLVKELQFDREKFEQYFRWTRESKIPPNYSGNTSPWSHILDSAVRFVFQVGVWIPTSGDSVCRIRIATQRHDESRAVLVYICKRSRPFTRCSIFAVSTCRLPHAAYRVYGILALSEDVKGLWRWLDVLSRYDFLINKRRGR